jgi:hypothetical protein
LAGTALVVALAVLFVAVGPVASVERAATGAGPTAGWAVVDGSVQSEVPSTNVTRRLTVDVDEGSDTATLSVLVAYPARSSAEADAAGNDSLEPQWFDGERRVREIFNRTADDDDQLTSVSRSVRHEPESWVGAGDPTPTHGWVLLRYEAAWEGYVRPGEDLVVGSTYSRTLANSTAGDRWDLRLVLPGEWEPSVVRGDPVVEPAGQTEQRYQWTVSGNVTVRLLVVESPVPTVTTAADGALGPASGIVVTTVSVTVALARRRSQRG